MREKRPFNPTTVAAALLAFAILVMSSVPKTALAQWVVTDPGVTAATTADLSLQTGNKVENTLLRSLGSTATLALINAARYFTQRIAYDAANYVAAGATGEKPFFETRSLGNYLQDTALDAAGEALATISEKGGWEELGINLCSPSTPSISLKIKLGYLKDLPGSLGIPLGPNQPKPRCEWKNITASWSEFASLPTDQVLDGVGAMFGSGESELSSALDFNAYAREQVAKKINEAQVQHQTNQGFRDLQSRAGDYTLTPAPVIKDEQQAIRDSQRALEQDQALIAATVQTGGIATILAPALNTFVNTLGEKLMKKVFEKGLILLSQAETEERDLYGTSDASPPTPGRVAAELANASLLTPRILSTTNFDELTEFATCPPDSRGPSNCVMDSQFFTAVTRAAQGSALTLRQAVEQGLVRGDFKLLPANHAKNRDKTCYLEAFCYSNLVKLRRARVIPVGWELAANSPFNDQNRPVSLKEAMNNFNNCPVDENGNFDPSKLPDPLHPWCHLVDPEWVLKYPKTICRQQAFGPFTISSQVAARGQTCVDSTSCIAEDASGNCVGGYGYCLREKGVWKLDADSCPAEYATCQALTSADGKKVSYLMNTVERGVCGPDNAGCKEYGLSANLVPNPSFEDTLYVPELRAREWQYASVGAYDRSGLKSLEGNAAIAVSSGAGASIRLPAVLEGVEYRLNASGLQDSDISGPFVGRAEIEFRDDQDEPILPQEGTCERIGDGATLSFDATYLGYNGASCTVKAPEGSVAAVLTLTSSAPASNPVWFDQIGLFGAGYSGSSFDRIHFNAKVQPCDGKDAGCTELIPLDGDSFNLVRNPSFEERLPQGNVPTAWTMPRDAYQLDGPASAGGISAALGAGAANEVSQVVQGVMAGATYTFAADARRLEAGDGDSGFARLTVLDVQGAALPASSQPDCDPASDTSRDLPLGDGEAFERTTCTFTAADGADALKIAFIAQGAGANPVIVDSVQLELGGATPFHAGHSSSTIVRLKKAPEGLRCTGGENDPAECAGYAPACRREEAGCNLYTPVEGGTAIPATISPSDACPSQCVGYAAFRQEPTVFADARFPVFFIPSTARACTASQVGCEEFTNLSKLASGGEAREFITSMRLCQKTDANTGTYYTWEGNDTSGYQLRVWTLMNSNVVAVATGASGSDPTGGRGPCTSLRYDASGRPACADDTAPQEGAFCSRADMAFNPDCREFYDVDGNIHYRLYSKTIVSAEECVEYRSTRAIESECRAHGGLWTNNECHYFGLPSENVYCAAASVGCRAYAGNASRNVRNAVESDFETGTTDGWYANANGVVSPNVANSNESVSAGGRSLKVTTGAVTKDVSDAIRKDRSYILTFWAKGNGDLSARFSAAAGTARFPTVALTTEWKPYTTGPIDVTVDPRVDAANPANDEQLIIEFAGNAPPQFFLDNIVLKEVSANTYVIADSWVTPAVCDRAPNGALSPQYMLGCSAYDDRNRKRVNLKSFDRLCGEDAVGCTAFYDTRNTPSPFAETFRAVCTLPDTAADADTLPDACDPSSATSTCPCQVTENGFSFTACQVLRGSTTCRYDIDGDAGNKLASVAPYDGHISPDGDTVRVRADALTYLIDRPEFRCGAGAVGCTAVGEPSYEPEGRFIDGWTSKSVKNLPSGYETTLCSKPEVSCQAYKRAEDGAPMFFKDPGKHLCEFRSNVVVAGVTVGGWFRKGSDTPCYDDYLVAGTQYGVWKNSDAAYEGWVGECQPQFSQCKEFIDPSDTSGEHPEGQPYYAILNDRLDTRTCRNQVSLTRAPSSAADASSCALFRQTDNLSLPYSSESTYALSASRNGALVAAVGDPATNDANIVIRVKRDRQCGEWLDCRSSETVWNASLNQFSNVCTAYAVCKRFVKVGDATRCAEYADGTTGSILTGTAYAARETGWEGLEYSGFSVPNQYPVQELVSVNISSSADQPDIRLVYSIGGTACNGKSYGDLCGPANTFGNQGTCLGPSTGRQCVYPIDGSAGIRTAQQAKQRYTLSGYPAASCRAYPQEDSPFPSSVADPGGWNVSNADLNNGNPVLSSPVPAFANVNVCQRRLVNGVEVSSCECNYQIASYGGATGFKKYFPIEESDVPVGYCQGGSYDGYECDPGATGLRTKDNPSCCSSLPDTESSFGTISASGCGDEAVCRAITKVDRVVGYQGQCLERDLSLPINNRTDEYACATWRPVGLVGGTRDIYNLYTTAGYFARPDRKHYCVGNKDRWMIDLGIDPNGTPNTQPTTKFFGPGKVSAAVDHYTSVGGNCSDDANSMPMGYAWCLYPGNSEKIRVSEDPDSTATRYGLTGDAIGILGCYEVADSSKGAPPSTIEYPYIGPPIYRDQLEGMYFQVADDVYYFGDDGGGTHDNASYTDQNPANNDAARAASAKIQIRDTSADDKTVDFGTNPTNPWQHVYSDCNDDGEDSIDSTADDSTDHLKMGDLPLQDADPATPGHQFKQSTNGVYYISDANNWQVDASDNEGSIILQALFDKSGKISGLKLSASDTDDEGTFGILRMGFVFKPGCDQLARVDEPGEFGLTKANTELVNDMQMYGTQPSRGLFEQSCRPWGAIGGITANPSKAPWTYVVQQDQTQPVACTGASFRNGAYYEKNDLWVLFRKIFGFWNYQELYNENTGLKQDQNYVVSSDSGTQSLNVPWVFDAGRCFSDGPLPINCGCPDGYVVTPTCSDVATCSSSRCVPGGQRAAPIVATVNDAACDASGNCPAGRVGSITLNGRGDGLIVATDGVLPVTARFFGWAAHDVMPIIRRTVLWGDTAAAEPPARGWYKNQKPFCSAGSTDDGAIGECAGTAGLTCRTAADCPAGANCVTGKNHFGNTPGACAPAPFQFDHTFICSAKELAKLPICCGNPATNAPCRRQDASVWSCVYRPAAQIIDNAGACNCTGSGCETPNVGESGAECNPATATSTRKPWTEYDGEIRLRPTAAETAKFQQMLADGAVSPPPACSVLPPILGGDSLFLAP